MRGLKGMKYCVDLCAISNCPPSTSESVQRQAYRFVFNPICEKSFIPPGKMSPQRVSKATKDADRCALLGLSMYVSKEKALNRYKYLKKNHKNIDKLIGTHLAKGEIEPKHGLTTKPNNQGHYDLFESKGVELSSDFKIISELSGV